MKGHLIARNDGYDPQFRYNSGIFKPIVWATFQVGHYPKSWLKRLGVRDF